MAFDPSKMTKSLGLKDPKVRDSEIQAGAISVLLQPLKELAKRKELLIDWSKHDWTFNGPIIACISKLYRLEEKQGTQEIFKGLSESCDRNNGILSVQEFTRITKCPDMSRFYYTYLHNSTEVYLKLFKVFKFDGRPLASLMDDYEERFNKLVSDSHMLVEQEWEEKAAKMVAAKANLQTSITARDEGAAKTLSYSDSVKRGKASTPQDNVSMKVSADMDGYKSPSKKFTAKPVTGNGVPTTSSGTRDDNQFGILKNLDDDEFDQDDNGGDILNDSQMSNMTGQSYTTTSYFEDDIVPASSNERKEFLHEKIEGEKDLNLEDIENMVAYETEVVMKDRIDPSAIQKISRKLSNRIFEQLKGNIKTFCEEEADKAACKLAEQIAEKEKIAMDFLERFEKYEKMQDEMKRLMLVGLKITKGLQDHVVPEERLQTLEEKVQGLQRQHESIDLTSDDTEQTSQVVMDDHNHDSSEKKEAQDNQKSTGDIDHLVRQPDESYESEEKRYALDDNRFSVHFKTRKDGTMDMYWPHTETYWRMPGNGTWVLVPEGWVQVTNVFALSNTYTFRAKFEGAKAEITYDAHEIRNFANDKPRFAHVNIDDAAYARGRSSERTEARTKRQASIEDTLDYHVKKEHGETPTNSQHNNSSNLKFHQVRDDNGNMNFMPYKEDYTPVLTNRQYIYPYDKHSKEKGPKISITSYNSSKISTAVPLDPKGKNFMDFWKKLRNILQDHGIKTKTYQQLEKDESIFEPTETNCFNYSSMLKESATVIYEMFNQSKEDLIPHDRFLQGQLNLYEEDRDGLQFLKDLMERHHPDFKVENCKEVTYGPKFKVGMTIYEFSKEIEKEMIDHGGYTEAEWCVYFLRKLDSRFEVGKKDLLDKYAGFCENEGRDPKLDERYKLRNIPKTVIKACSSDPEDHNLLSGPRPESKLQVNRYLATESTEVETDDDDELQINAFNSYRNNRRNNTKSYSRSRYTDDKSDYDDKRNPRYKSGYNRGKNQNGDSQKRTNMVDSCPRCAKLCGRDCENLGLIVPVKTYLEEYGNRITNLDQFRSDLQNNKEAAIKKAQRSFRSRQDIRAQLAEMPNQLFGQGWSHDDLLAHRATFIEDKLSAMPDLFYASADMELHNDAELMLA